MNRRGLAVLVVVLLAIASLFFYIKFFDESDRLERVIFFNVGQGDSILINFSNGQKMLVDCGVDRSVLSKLGKYIPFYDRTIDYLVITHPDSDHYGGCLDVLRRYRVKNIIENGVTKPKDSFWQVWDRDRKREGAILQTISNFQTVVIGSSTLEFLSPDSNLNIPAKDKDGNNASIVFRLLQNGKSLLFVGDAEIPLERALTKKYCSDGGRCEALQADFLKVGHHGSDSSSGDEFLSLVSPQVAIISVGKNNFGHPSLRIFKHLERIGAQIWRTDLKDDIIIR